MNHGPLLMLMTAREWRRWMCWAFGMGMLTGAATLTFGLLLGRIIG